MRILSGIQPSGSLHLGNYFAMMKPMIEYQETETLFCFIVNYHALTTVFDHTILRQNTFEAICDFLSLGLDPDKATIFIQSQVPQCTELAWIFNTITPIAELERMTQFKDKSQKHSKNIK